MSKLDYCNIPVLYKRVTVEHHNKMREWLYENIDPECYDAERWETVNGTQGRKIWFAKKQDAVIFALRWA